MKLPLKERIGLGLLLAMLITNPLTGQYVLQFLDWAFQHMFLYGAYISIAGSVYLLVLLGVYYHKSTKIKLPTTKTKSQAYIKT